MTLSTTPADIVAKLSSLLVQGPTHLEITILPDLFSCETASEGRVLSLDESLSLVEGRYLGIDARSLPAITAGIRQEYKHQKALFRNLGNNSNDSNDNALQPFLTTTSCLLLVNPDHATVWADRRRCMLQISEKSNGKMDSIWKTELDYLNLLMTQHSKAPFSWAHRKYILEKLMGTIRSDFDDEIHVVSLFKDEVRVCREVAERYPKNYYAWTHRRYILGSVLSCQQLSSATTNRFLEMEWEDMLTQWLPFHVSDHSAVHYASQVLELWLFNLKKSKSVDSATVDHIESASLMELKQLVPRVMHQVRSLIKQHDNHEALWILRRLVVRTFFETVREHGEEVIREDICCVAAIFLQRSNEHKLDLFVPNIHALTFLAWIQQVLQQGKTQVSSNTNQKGLQAFHMTESDAPCETSVQELMFTLRNHPLVYHCLWKDATSKC